jgi:hypothetical protein
MAYIHKVQTVVSLSQMLEVRNSIFVHMKAEDVYRYFLPLALWLMCWTDSPTQSEPENPVCCLTHNPAEQPALFDERMVVSPFVLRCFFSGVAGRAEWLGEVSTTGWCVVSRAGTLVTCDLWSMNHIARHELTRKLEVILRRPRFALVGFRSTMRSILPILLLSLAYSQMLSPLRLFRTKIIRGNSVLQKTRSERAMAALCRQSCTRSPRAWLVAK